VITVFVNRPRAEKLQTQSARIWRSGGFVEAQETLM
jgi:hypothetical protein